ncbi:restriction endonuclease subunit S [Vibrio splendidus]
MGSKWRTKTIKEIGNVITGKTPPGTKEIYFGGEVNFLTPSDMDESKYVESTQRTLSVSGAEVLKKNLIEKGIAVSCIGWQMGKSVIINSPTVTNQQINTLIPDSAQVDIEFLYYVLKLKRQEIFNLGATATRTPIVKKSLFEKIEIEFPEDLKLQKSIAQTLRSLDNKIILNKQINQTLEQMAQTLFKSWFVDFDPVKAKMNGEQPKGMDAATALLFPEKLVESKLGLIPEGWEETPLYDIAEYINGAAYKKFEPNGEGLGLPIIKIAELKAGVTSKTGFSTVDMPQKYKLDDTDILFSWSGNPDTSIDTFVWALGEAWLNQHIFKVVPKSDLSRDYVLCLLKYMRPVFAEIARDKQTTGLGHVTVKDLKRLTVAVPSEELLIKFNEKVSAIIAHNFSLVKENQTLEKLRDTLLPKLLSGEIDLENVQVEQAKALAE